MSTTRLICTECGEGSLTAIGEDFARCEECSQGLIISRDVAPFADDASLSIDREGYLVATTND